MGTLFDYEGKTYRVERISAGARRYVFWDNHTGHEIGWAEPDEGTRARVHDSELGAPGLIRELVRAAADIGAVPGEWAVA